MTLALCAGALLAAQAPDVPPPPEISTVLMQSTFHLQAPSITPGEKALGTAFVLARPCVDRPRRGRHTLITAAHVLRRMQGDMVTMVTREKGSDGRWLRKEVSVPIRNGREPLWLQHKHADVAVLPVSLPSTAIDRAMSTDFLATEEMLERYEVHPGDELLTLGFPLGVEGSVPGFPILRAGRLASYPLIPVERVRTFLVDTEVFPGNSGSPVYIWNIARRYNRGIQFGLVQFILGMLTDKVTPQVDPSKGLALAQAVHARFISETLALLPEARCGEGGFMRTLPNNANIRDRRKRRSLAADLSVMRP